MQKYNNFVSLRILHVMMLSAVFATGIAGCSDSDNSSSTSTNISQTTVVGPAGGTAQSPDGRLTISFGAGAVGMDTEITIRQEMDEPLGDGLEDLLAENSYELQPDGLVFAEPVQVQYLSSAQSAGSVTVPLLFLVSVSNDIPDLLGNVAVRRREDGQVLATGDLAHFSRLVVINRFLDENGNVVVLGSHTVTGLPLRALVGENFPLTFEVQSNVGPLLPSFGSTVVEESFISIRNMVLGSARQLNLVRSSGAVHDYELKLPSNHCSLAESFFGFDTFVSNRFEIDQVRPISLRALVRRSSQTGYLFLRIDGNGRCIDDFDPIDPNPPGVKITSGPFQIRDGETALAKPEAIQELGEHFGNLQAEAGSTLIAVIGAQASLVFDLATKAIVFGAVGAAADPTRNGQFGYAGATQPNPGTTTPAALLSYSSPSGSPFGGFLLNYDTGSQAFGSFGQLLSGSFVDAYPVGGEVVSDEILGCASGGSTVVRYDANLKLYEQGDDFDVGRECISMIAATANGPVLSVSITAGRFDNSRLYFTDRSGSATEVGVVGTDARRIRHKNGLAAVTLFAEDALRLVQWDGSNSPTILPDTIGVGDGPVDLDLRANTDGNLEILTPGFNDNSLSITTADTSGSLISNEKFAAPSGCLQPAHPIFIENADDATDPFVVASCFGSDSFFTSKVSELVAFDED